MRLENERGSVLITLIIAMVLMAVLGAGIYVMTTSSAFSELLSNRNDNAYQLAKTGIRYAANLLAENGKSYTLPETTFLIQDGNGFKISIATDSSTGRKIITSKGTVNKDTFLSSNRELTYNMPPPPPGIGDPGYYEIYSGGSGGLSIPSGGKITGSVYAKSVSILAANVEISGNIVSETSITLGSSTKVSGFLCANGDVTLTSADVTVGGDINAHGNVTLESAAIASGNVFADGNVTLKAHKNHTSVIKNIHAGNDVLLESGSYANQNVYAGGKLSLLNSGSQVKKDAHTGGNVILQNNTTILGSVWAGGTIPSYKTNISGAKLENQPVPPRILPTAPTACPVVPKSQLQTQICPTGGADIVVAQSSSKTITPGKYGNLTFGGAATLTIKAGDCSNYGDAGCYYFNKFQGGLWGQTLRLDLSTGPYITIFSCGDILHSGIVQVSTDGSTWQTITTMNINTAKELAKRVYWETAGNFQITTDNGTRQWFGTVLSKNNITIPSAAWIIGSLDIVNGVFSSDANATITYVLSDFARDHW